jgi:predicted transcriptional regulator
MTVPARVGVAGRRTTTEREVWLPSADDLFHRAMSDEPVAEEPELGTLVSLFDDDHVRSILVATSAEPLSAAELAERCEVSVSAIYRRTNRLVDADLLRERTRPRSDGHHETVYVTALERFELSVRDGDLHWSVERTETDVADELTRLWGKF